MKHWAILGALALLYCARISHPPSEYGSAARPGYVLDECFEVFTAHRLALGETAMWRPGAEVDFTHDTTPSDLAPCARYEWMHPPAARLVMAGAIRLFGFAPAVYRMGGVVCALVIALVTFLLGRRIGGAKLGLLAMILVGSDGLMLVTARTAMLDIYVTAALVTLAWMWWRWLDGERAPRGMWMLGVVLGLGLACKWTMLPAWPMCAVATLLASRRDRRRFWPYWIASFVLIPLALYFATYAPALVGGVAFSDIVRLQGAMWRHHVGLDGHHPFASPFWSWPLVLRPLVYHLARARIEGHDRVAAIWGIPNLLLWWSMLPLFAWQLWRALGRRDVAAMLLAALFAMVWLPWAMVPRGDTFLYYLVPAVPFASLMAARALIAVEQRHRRSGGALAVAAVAASLALLWWFYPVLTARALDLGHYRAIVRPWNG